MMFLVIIALCLAVILNATLKSVFELWKCRKIAGPQPRLPLIGNVLLFYKTGVPLSRTLYITIREMAVEFKNQGFALLFLKSKLLFLFKAPFAREFLKDNSLILKPIEYNIFESWLGDGLITASGHKWKTLRKILNTTFHSKILECYIPIINEQCNKLVEEISGVGNNEYVDIRSLISDTSLNIIAATVMGITLDKKDKDVQDYRNCLRSIEILLLARVYNPFYWNDFLYFNLPAGREAKRQIRLLHSFTENVIRKRKQNFVKDFQFGTSKQMAFLDQLISVQMQNAQLTDKDIREQVDTFFFAGHETTTICITYTLLLVGNDQRVQRKIITELNSIFGDAQERHVTMDDINKMHYIENVIKESLRVFPPVPFIGRVMNEDFTFNGHCFDKETNIIISIRDTHMDGNVYENPNEFIPERFETNNYEGLFFPFAFGPRSCVGQRFAMIDMKIILCHIFRNFKIKCSNIVEDVEICAEVVSYPASPILINFVKGP